MLPTGKVEVVTSTSPHGQGHETAWSQIAADALGVPCEDVEVIHGDTRSAPMGMDTYGSRSLVVGGIAVHKACEKVIDKAKKVAAHLLEASEGDLEFDGGKFTVKGSPDASLSIQEIALATFAAHNLPDGVEPSLNSDFVMDPENFSFPHGTHLCAVEVDTETGFTTIRSYVCVDDIGNVINPLIVEGQVHGGLAQGIAQALYDDAKVLAGGQSLIPLLRLRLAYPSVLVDVSGVAEMTGVRDDGDAIVIGAAVTHADVIAHALVRQHAPLVVEATKTVADRQVRHRGTFGGSLSHADPAGDLPSVAVALDAEFVIAGAGGRRTVRASEFFQDYLQTAIGAQDLL